MLRDAHPWRVLFATCATVAVLGAMIASASAQVVGAPDVVGQWTIPFEEGGAGVPRCQPAPDDKPGYDVCKTVAQAAALLPDGRLVYFSGLESQYNAKGGTLTSTSASTRDSQTRLLDLRSGVPDWAIPSPERGGQYNPNIREGHQGPDDPLGMAGVPGRPGDGFVGSTWGQLGGPEHDPTSAPDDPADNDGDMFCGDLTLLPDGRVLVAGGSDWYNEPALMDRRAGDSDDVGLIELEGLRNANLFDHRTNTWTAAGHMKYGRWYPGMAIGPDGRATVFSGVTKLVKSTQLSQVRRSETFDADTNTWEENYVGPQSEASLNLQPRMVLTPGGKFFYTAVGQWGTFGQAIDEVLFNFNQAFDPATKTWEIVGLAPLGAVDGAAVVPLPLKAPYDRIEILTLGGALGMPPPEEFATPFSYVTTVDQAGRASHQMKGLLHHARWFPSAVLLPDGQVLATGGMDKVETNYPGIGIPVKIPELYDPRTGRWTEVAAHSRDRTYHHTALLMPDMRVLFGGHVPIAANFGGSPRDQGGPMANNDPDPSFEVWSPPYLFRGARPSISHAQSGLDYGESFMLGTPQASEIESVVLLKTPSVQHVNDSDQRSLELDFRHDGDDRLEVVTPPSGTVAPPGYYYLVVNKKSPRGPIPSVARIVRVGLGTDAAEAIQPYADDVAAPVGTATPDEDTSHAAAAQSRAREAMSSAPAPVSGPAVAAVNIAADTYRRFDTLPAR